MSSVTLYQQAPINQTTYFQWSIFIDSATKPSTPTGGVWSFDYNTGNPPVNWSNTPPASVANKVWQSLGIVDSRNPSTITWSAPGALSK